MSSRLRKHAHGQHINLVTRVDVVVNLLVCALDQRLEDDDAGHKELLQWRSAAHESGRRQR